MSRLFITDMDGTLLGNDARVSRLSAEIISGLSRDGALITVATARTPATVEPLLADTFTSIPAIVLTGATMWDRDTQRFFNVHTMPNGSVGWIIRTFADHGISPFVYTLPSSGPMNVYHSRQLTPQEKNFYIDRAHLRLKRFTFQRELSPTLMEGTPVLMLGIAPIQSIMALAGVLRDTGLLSVTAYPDIFNPSTGYIEVFAAGVSKAAAIIELRELIGADTITAYGDNLNDIPMLMIADDAVAVGNALDEVKQAASRVIGPNTASSVAQDILQHF